MNIAPIEGLWLAINLFSLGVTFSNLVDALDSWRAVRGTSEAWQVQARANLRSEGIRLLQVAALIIVVLPALTRPGDVPLTWSLAVFMAVPAGLALNGYLDRRTRRTLERLVAES
jgi:hypothetical protein